MNNTICLIWQIKSSRFKTMLVLAEAQGHGHTHSMSLRVVFGRTILFIETVFIVTSTVPGIIHIQYELVE